MSSAEEAAAAALIAPHEAFVLGSQFMGAIFDALFAGVILCQLSHWVFSAKHDTRLVQVVVGVGATATLLTTSYTWATYLMAFVYDYGNFARFASFSMLGWYAIFDAFTVIPVQIFFTDRAVRINNNSKFVLFGAGFLILATAASATGVTIVTRGQTMVAPTRTVKLLALVWPTVCTSAHVFITTSIVYGLLKTRTHADHTNKIVNRVVAISIESQLPASIFAVAAMTTMAANSRSPLIPFIMIVHPKVFMVGCLAMVNLRHSWRIKGKVPSSYQSADSQLASGASAPGLSSSGSHVESAGPTTPTWGAFPRSYSTKSEELSDLESGHQMDDFKLHGEK